MNDKITLPKKTYEGANYSVSITPEAVSMLRKVVAKTSLSARQAASTIIIQAIKKDLIAFEEEEEEKC